MRVEALTKAIVEAKRFLETTKKVKIKHGWSPSSKGTIIDYTKESAACKRASMDLTRALSEMRKP